MSNPAYNPPEVLGVSEFPKWLAVIVLLITVGNNAFAQSYREEFTAPDRVSLSLRNRDGRISIIASDDQQNKVIVEAASTGRAVASSDVKIDKDGDSFEISVADRPEKDRIDLVVRIPSRSKVDVESEAGAVDVIGNFEAAAVRTNTGTIHADVPLEALKFNFLWQASKPRYMSDVELPEIKEKRGGFFSISGKLGEKKPKKGERSRARVSNATRSGATECRSRNGAQRPARASTYRSGQRDCEAVATVS